MRTGELMREFSGFQYNRKRYLKENKIKKSFFPKEHVKIAKQILFKSVHLRYHKKNMIKDSNFLGLTIA